MGRGEGGGEKGEDTLTSNVIYQASNHSKTVKNIDQLNNSSEHVLGLNIGRLVTDWSVDNMNPDMTPYMILLDVCISQKKKKQE